MCLCVYVGVRVCVCACVCECACVCMCVFSYVCTCVCVYYAGQVDLVGCLHSYAQLTPLTGTEQPTINALADTHSCARVTSQGTVASVMASARATLHEQRKMRPLPVLVFVWACVFACVCVCVCGSPTI